MSRIGLYVVSLSVAVESHDVDVSLRIKLALLEHDEKQLYTARQNLYDIRNVYAILTDILHKNINKVSVSLSSNGTRNAKRAYPRFAHPRATILLAFTNRLNSDFSHTLPRICCYFVSIVPASFSHVFISRNRWKQYRSFKRQLTKEYTYS